MQTGREIKFRAWDGKFKLHTSMSARRSWTNTARVGSSQFGHLSRCRNHAIHRAPRQECFKLIKHNQFLKVVRGETMMLL